MLFHKPKKKYVSIMLERLKKECISEFIMERVKIHPQNLMDNFQLYGKGP